MSLYRLLSKYPDEVIESLDGLSQFRARDQYGALLSETHHSRAFHMRFKRVDGTWSRWSYADIDSGEPCRVVAS